MLACSSARPGACFVVVPEPENPHVSTSRRPAERGRAGPSSRDRRGPATRQRHRTTARSRVRFRLERRYARPHHRGPVTGVGLDEGRAPPGRRRRPRRRRTARAGRTGAWSATSPPWSGGRRSWRSSSTRGGWSPPRRRPSAARRRGRHGRAVLGRRGGPPAPARRVEGDPRGCWAARTAWTRTVRRAGRGRPVRPPRRRLGRRRGRGRPGRRVRPDGSPAPRRPRPVLGHLGEPVPGRGRGPDRAGRPPGTARCGTSDRGPWPPHTPSRRRPCCASSSNVTGCRWTAGPPRSSSPPPPARARTTRRTPSGSAASATRASSSRPRSGVHRPAKPGAGARAARRGGRRGAEHPQVGARAVPQRTRWSTRCSTGGGTSGSRRPTGTGGSTRTSAPTTVCAAAGRPATALPAG